MGPNTGALAPRARPEAGLGVGAGGVAPSRCGGHPRKFFENSDAKSCILVASALISGLPRTCISEQTTSMSRAKSVPKFQLLGRGCALVVRTKNQSDGNYETCKWDATRHLGP